MCGRFVLKHDPVSIKEWYGAVSMPRYAARYNIAPGTEIIVIRNTHQGRRGSLMRWGLVPAWMKERSAVPALINARGETVAEKPVFRHAFQRRRCLIPASGFYEWQAVPGHKTKQPFYISSKDDTPISFAGLWESAASTDGEVTETCTIITTLANRALQPVHDRMPVILDRGAWDTWLSLDPVTQDTLKELIQPGDASRLQLWPVSAAVNRTANDSDKLIAPLAAEAQLDLR
ncbi:MAG TPA: SOS response-associated peptidase [Burkholderiaceae bacterium]|nr:SOS response-associated peptidase [Burkholderiaceae bacterium]